MATEFSYTLEANISQLEQEIADSEITIATRSIVSNNMEVVILFKTDLSNGEIALLELLIEDHEPQASAVPDLVQLNSQHKPEDNTLVVYPTTIPDGWHVCFQGSGDSEDELGEGEKAIFHISSRDAQIYKDLYFNQDVYLKDGYMISKGAPFGASVDIEVVHPAAGVLKTFAKNVPIFGSGWFPMDTDARALLPKGLGIRLTIKNSTGGAEIGQSKFEQPPADFWFAGRFELYRK